MSLTRLAGALRRPGCEGGVGVLGGDDFGVPGVLDQDTLMLAIKSQMTITWYTGHSRLMHRRCLYVEPGARFMLFGCGWNVVFVPALVVLAASQSKPSSAAGSPPTRDPPSNSALSALSASPASHLPPPLDPKIRRSARTVCAICSLFAQVPVRFPQLPPASTQTTCRRARSPAMSPSSAAPTSRLLGLSTERPFLTCIVGVASPLCPAL